MADKKTRKFGNGGAAAYPIRIDLEKNKRDTAARDRARPQSRPAPPITQRDLDRHARTQAEEARESGVMKKARRYAAGGVTKVMPTSKQMGDLNMAKGGSAKAKAKTKAKTNAKTKAMMAAAMMKDRMGRAMAARGNKDLMGRAMAARGAEAPMAPAGPPMGMGMKKGGKAKAKPFAATKFGAAMMKKSDDTKGRAMKKMAKGGGIESRGKTKAKMVKM
jgi:hypothetical protein